MKIQKQFVLTVAMTLAAVTTAMAAAAPNSAPVPAQMVVTVEPHKGNAEPVKLQADDLKVTEGKSTVPVVNVQQLAGDLADMQLFVLLDDSTRSSSLSTQLADLRSFLKSLPATAQVAVGYMHNGTFSLGQAFTADHQKAADALRLPAAIPGENGSPYFVLSDLAKHWPSKHATDRRAVLVLTDGVDRYYGNAIVDDPYVDTAIRDDLQNGITVYSIYLRGAGRYGLTGRETNFAQSRLLQVSDETGGYAYFEGFTDPVSIAPFLDNFLERLASQYRVTIQALGDKGVQPVKLKTEQPGLKVVGPSRIYTR